MDMEAWMDMYKRLGTGEKMGEELGWGQGMGMGMGTKKREGWMIIGRGGEREAEAEGIL